MQANSHKAVVWSQDNCSYCTSAKSMLIKRGYTVEERMIGEGHPYSKKDLIDAVPNARTVPQIFINSKYVGNFTDLNKYLNDNNKNT